MNQFQEKMQAFLSRQVGIDAVSDAIRADLSFTPQVNGQIISILNQLYETGRIENQVYSQLSALVESIAHQNRSSSAASPTSTFTGYQNTNTFNPASYGTRTQADPHRAAPNTAIVDPMDMQSADTMAFQSMNAAANPGGASQPRSVGVSATLKSRFVLEQAIARGGMGVVYKARDLRKEEAMDREPYVAIKVLNENFRKRPDSFMALQREAKKAQKLAHPNIVTVYDFDRDGENVFMTMEYLEGESLDEVIRRTQPNPLPKNTALKIIDGMTRGLAYAHQQNIVHSDFKPGNVFLNKDQVVKVLDFGIARAIKRPGQSQQEATVFDAGSLGALTPAYASCEMLEDQEPDPRDDIYALACVAYQLLAGRHPFNKLQATQARDSNLKPAPIKSLSRRQWKALVKGLEFDREKRTPTVLQFLSEISEFRRPGSRLGTWMMALSFTVLVAISFLLFQSNKPTDEAEEAVIDPKVAMEEFNNMAPEKREKIERLLEVAEAHMLVGRFAEPPGSNAVDTYNLVLNIHPRNIQALSKLQEIAARYEQEAIANWQKGDLESSMLNIDAGLKAVPSHKGLRALQQRVREAQGK